MKLYLSSKMSGLPNNNYPEFERMKNKYINKGYEVVSPHDLSKEVEAIKEAPEWIDYMKNDIKALIECDCICMFGDWMNSKGARVEYSIANGLGLNIIIDEE